VASPPSVPGFFGSVRGGWSLLTTDPFGLLLPTAGMLLVDAVLASAARSAAAAPHLVLALLLLLFVARPFLHAPFLARLLANAARLEGVSAWPWGRPVALLGTELVVAPLVAGAFGLPVLLGGALAATVANEGWLATAAVSFAGLATIGAFLSLAVRAMFARATWEVAVLGRSSAAALWEAVRTSPEHAPMAFLLLGAGDLLVGASAATCGALVLPGYALAWLALAHGWGRRPEAP